MSWNLLKRLHHQNNLCSLSCRNTLLSMQLFLHPYSNVILSVQARKIQSSLSLSVFPPVLCRFPGHHVPPAVCHQFVNRLFDPCAFLHFPFFQQNLHTNPPLPFHHCSRKSELSAFRLHSPPAGLDATPFPPFSALPAFLHTIWRQTSAHLSPQS